MSTTAKPVDPATYQRTPEYKLKNPADNPYTKGKKKISDAPLQYDWPEEAFEGVVNYQTGVINKGDRRSEWLKRHGLKSPTYAWRVVLKLKTKVDGKSTITELPAYECWAVDEGEALKYTFKTYKLAPVDCVYENPIRVDEGY